MGNIFSLGVLLLLKFSFDYFRNKRTEITSSDMCIFHWGYVRKEAGGLV